MMRRLFNLPSLKRRARVSFTNNEASMKEVENATLNIFSCLILDVSRVVSIYAFHKRQNRLLVIEWCTKETTNMLFVSMERVKSYL